MSDWFSKNVVLGISAGISAYKSAELASILRKLGANVQVVMTKQAKAFVGSMTFQAVTERPVRDSLWDEAHESAMGHIELARWADLVLIAPATADMIAKLACGQASCLLSTLILATNAPVVVCPAMNMHMYAHPLTQKNINILKEIGAYIVGPSKGVQACGDDGWGRMVEPADIVHSLSELFQEKILADLKLLITAGPTREPIDPVRYISNRSSGKMGYALAEAAVNLGAKVTLISGPTTLSSTAGIHRVEIETADEMLKQVLNYAGNANVFISSAAVSDYRLADVSTVKIKKHNEKISLDLIQNPDILAHVAKVYPKLFLVGFAAETCNVKVNALAKLEKKNLDIIFANDVSRIDIGFENEQNEIVAFTKDSEKIFAKQPKARLAYDLLRYIAIRYRK